MGNRTRRTDPLDTTVFQPDRLNRTAEVTPGSGGGSHMEYTAQGRVQQIQQPNGALQTNTYDELGRIAQISQLQNNVVLQQTTYGYDPHGNRSTESIAMLTEAC